MKDEVILQKIDSLVRCLERLKSKSPVTIEELQNNVDLQDIVVINLERLVQISVDITGLIISKLNLSPIPSNMGQGFMTLGSNKILSTALADRLQKAVGFRNICVHEYDKIDWNIVLTILEKHLCDFRELGKVAEAIAKD